MTETVMVEGAVAEVGLTESQLPPECVATVAVQPRTPAPTFCTVKVCDDGFLPAEAVNSSEAGFKAIVGVPSTNVTNTVGELVEAPGEETVIEPW